MIRQHRNMKHAFLFFQALFFLLCRIESFSQERKDEQLPTVSGPVKSISNLTPWRRNDIGKWEQSSPFGDQTLKIEVAKVTYEKKEYYCFVRFAKHFYIKYNKQEVEYSAWFWLFDLDSTQDLDYEDSSVHTRIYNCAIVSEVLSLFKPSTWNDIILQLKRCFIGTYPNEGALNTKFFLKYRYTQQSNKAQLYFGSLPDYARDIDTDQYDDFTYHALCHDKDKNQNLNCCYFESPKTNFDNCFRIILK